MRLVAGVLLAVGALAPPTVAAADFHVCRDERARRVARDGWLSVARNTAGDYAACRGRRTLRYLGSSDPVEGWSVVVAVQRPYVAWATNRRRGKDTGYEVSVFDAATRRARSGTPPDESDFLDALVVRDLSVSGHGATAWIAFDPVAQHGRTTVGALDRRGVSVLARDSNVRSGSLRLHGQHVSWRDGSRSRSATLQAGPFSS